MSSDPTTALAAIHALDQRPPPVLSLLLREANQRWQSWQQRQDDSRPLSSTETRQLERQGNRAQDWGQVRVGPGFDPALILDNAFLGPVRLGAPGTEEARNADPTLPRGVRGCRLAMVWIADGASLADCPGLSWVMIDQEASLLGVRASGPISGPDTSFGLGEHLRIGIEGGRRRLPLLPGLSLEAIESILFHPADSAIQAEAGRRAAAWSQDLRSPFTYLGPGSHLDRPAAVHAVALGPRTFLGPGTTVERSFLSGVAEDPVRVESGATVRECLLEAAVHVTDGALVQRSLLLEHSHAGQHGIVNECCIAPNSGVERGEAVASFLGPFVGFHHQALLIAALWPEGRGNVGYGAMIGSNHTSRLPDQEVWIGEGMFFGLGCLVKFPGNYRDAPYTVVATGLTLPPQRLQYPFSLINEARLPDPRTQGLNQLIPAWSLRENLYALARNEQKYRDRDASRWTSLEHRIFHPANRERMRQALERLRAVDRLARSPDQPWLPTELPGLGRTFMSEADRLAAVETYAFFLHWLDRLDLLENLETGPGFDPADATLSELDGLVEQAGQMVDVVKHSLERDWERGSRIIPDYEQTHGSLADDPFLVRYQEHINGLLERVAAVRLRVQGP